MYVCDICTRLNPTSEKTWNRKNRKNLNYRIFVELRVRSMLALYAGHGKRKMEDGRKKTEEEEERHILEGEK